MLKGVEGPYNTIITLAQACRSRNIPVIFDEVMTGLYRLGAISAATLLRQNPDIACYAKILTSGAVPMASNYIANQLTLPPPSC